MCCKLQKDCPPFLRANLQLQLPDNLHSQFLTQGEHCFVRPYWPAISLKCCASFSWKLSFVAKRTLECPSFSCQRQSQPVFWPINLKWSFKNKILRGSRLKIGGCPRSFPCRKGILAMSVLRYIDLVEWCGREIRSDKRGSIPGDLTPILGSLGLDGQTLIGAVLKSGNGLQTAEGLSSVSTSEFTAPAT